MACHHSAANYFLNQWRNFMDNTSKNTIQSNIFESRTFSLKKNKSKLKSNRSRRFLDKLFQVTNGKTWRHFLSREWWAMASSRKAQIDFTHMDSISNTIHILHFVGNQQHTNNINHTSHRLFNSTPFMSYTYISKIVQLTGRFLQF